jgi:uracil-DNA glycosylase family 4
MKKISNINNCRDCNLYKNQRPLLQNDISPCEVMFVGLSAIKTNDVENDEPFSPISKSGKLLREITHSISEDVYFTNIVKCLPLLGKKIRYPNKIEMSACLENFKTEINEIRPKKIILFGKNVSSHVSKKFGFKFNNNFLTFPVGEYEGIKIMDAYHPSYVLIYKSRDILEYKSTIVKFAQS